MKAYFIYDKIVIEDGELVFYFNSKENPQKIKKLYIDNQEIEINRVSYIKNKLKTKIHTSVKNILKIKEVINIDIVLIEENDSIEYKVSLELANKKDYDLNEFIIFSVYDIRYDKEKICIDIKFKQERYMKNFVNEKIVFCLGYDGIILDSKVEGSQSADDSLMSCIFYFKDFHFRNESGDITIVIKDNNYIYKIGENHIENDMLNFNFPIISSEKLYNVSYSNCEISYQLKFYDSREVVNYLGVDKNKFKIEIMNFWDNKYLNMKVALVDKKKNSIVYFDQNLEDIYIKAYITVDKVLENINLYGKDLNICLVTDYDKYMTLNTRYNKAQNVHKYTGIKVEKYEIKYRYNSENMLVLSMLNKVKQTEKIGKSHFATLPLKMKIKYTCVIVYSYIIYLISIILKNSNKYKGIWLVGEMDDTAQDNGYHFFKYIRTKYTDKKCYYLINRNSPDLSNIEKYGNIIYRTTFKHILYTFLAEKYIGTHDYRHWHYPGYANLFDKVFRNKLKGEFIQLQHGVMHLKSERGFHYDERKYYHKIVVTSDHERQLLSTYFKHPIDNLIVTGLARYDNLFDESLESREKIITIMPTWRKGLRGGNFTKSEYYKRWSEILHDKDLGEYLKTNNIVVEFYLHIKLKAYTEIFEKDLASNIRIISHGEKSVQSILKTSKLMITDYSSVSFDFAYMNKPVIFYQYDYLAYIRSYNVVDWDDYVKGRFGYIGHKKEEIIDKIKYYVENEFKMEKQYMDKAEIYFKYRDRNNCERIYEAIENK